MLPSNVVLSMLSTRRPRRADQPILIHASKARSPETVRRADGSLTKFMSTTTPLEIRLPDVEINVVKVKNPVEVVIRESRIATVAASPNFIRHITFDVSASRFASATC